jgi:hypothetical protein
MHYAHLVVSVGQGWSQTVCEDITGFSEDIGSSAALVTPDSTALGMTFYPSRLLMIRIELGAIPSSLLLGLFSLVLSVCVGLRLLHLAQKWEAEFSKLNSGDQVVHDLQIETVHCGLRVRHGHSVGTSTL